MPKSLIRGLIELVETPYTYRFVLSDGRIVDVTAYAVDSSTLRGAVLKAIGKGGASVVTVIRIEDGGIVDGVNVVVWDPPIGESEPEPSSTASVKSSATPKRGPRVRSKK